MNLELLAAAEMLFADAAQRYRQRYCWLHGWEVRLADAYRVCAECGHAYVTEEALLNEHRVERWEINHYRERALPTPLPPLPTFADIEAITYCPLCGTDWEASTP